jgi:periplasmic protein TonB
VRFGADFPQHMSSTENDKETAAMLPGTAAVDRVRMSWRREAGTPTMALLTTVLWTTLLSVGLLGLGVAPAVSPVARPAPLPLQVALQVEILEVELVDEALPPAAVEVPEQLNPIEQPPALEPVPLPTVPALVEVAAPEAVVAFPLPVTGPVRIVETAQASFARPVETALEPPVAVNPVAIQTLVYGQGEGRQPKPEYPRQAQRERQEGTVTVRFTVGSNWRVLEAALSSPAPWPLLNDSALRVIRDRWRFSAGNIRAYEVAIRFVL